MSILDFTTGLFRDPANLSSFVGDPDQALIDAGLPDATPEQVHDLLPVVAESMPPDHPLQTVVHSVDPAAALAELDVDAETIHIGHWDLVEAGEKGLGDLFMPHIAQGDAAPVDEYPETREDDELDSDHALDDGGIDLDVGTVVWGKALE